MFIIQMFVKI